MHFRAFIQDAFIQNIRQRFPGRSCSRVALCLVLSFAALGAACSSESAKGAQAAGPSGVPVKLQEVKSVPISDATEYVATLKSRDSAAIMPEVEGRITQIYV